MRKYFEGCLGSLHWKGYTAKKCPPSAPLALVNHGWPKKILALPEYDKNRTACIDSHSSCILSSKIMHLRYRTSGFTLIEVLVGVMLSGLILTAAYSSFQGIMKSEIRLGGVIDIQRNLFYLNEKLASLIHDGGTLDYEEYFNRRMLGYEQDFVPKNPDDLAQ